MVFFSSCCETEWPHSVPMHQSETSGICCIQESFSSIHPRLSEWRACAHAQKYEGLQVWLEIRLLQGMFCKHFPFQRIFMLISESCFL